MYSIEQFKALTVPASMVITQHSRKRFAERHIMIRMFVRRSKRAGLLSNTPMIFLFPAV